MERILDENEKIKRAEEIYYRRNNKNILLTERSDTKNKSNIKNKIVLNFLIMINISIIVFSVQNKDFIFTKEFLNVLSSYNNDISLRITDSLKKFVQEDKENVEEKENIIIPEENNNSTIESNELNNSETISSSLDEMELDIRNLKVAYSFITPIKGTVSSGFGSRESIYQNVTGYHTGIDIAKENGSIIKASMQGIVDLVSDEGDYGKHIKIRCNNVTTLYAHCSKIYVKEGQIVSQGQDIAEVGNTGNSTGAHLHFEIRIDDRFVDPAKVINF